ncbi:MAG: hypothetical protein IT323_08380 [Anaerolineae bacterium]|nr:hypothetical protein [Anaerolineae bacterium]
MTTPDCPMTDAAPRLFRYHIEPAAAPFLVGVGLLVVALLLPGGLRLAATLAAAGPLVFAALQALRRGRMVRLGADGLHLHGSLSGRRRTVRYDAIRGITATRQGGLGVLYHERSDPGPPSGADQPPSLDRLRAEANPAFPPRQRLIVTAPLDNVEGLLDELRRCCPALGGVSPRALDRLVRRRQWRDRLIALMALLGTPLYVMVAARIMVGIL